jgi:hypothetical protein
MKAKLLAMALAFSAGGACANELNLSVGFNANIATVTLTGTVVSGVDSGGLFGPTGANLAGDPFSLVYVFDTSLGSPDHSAGRTGVDGGTIFTPGFLQVQPPPTKSLTSPSLGAIFSVNGNSKYIGGNFEGYLAWGAYQL